MSVRKTLIIAVILLPVIVFSSAGIGSEGNLRSKNLQMDKESVNHDVRLQVQNKMYYMRLSTLSNNGKLIASITAHNKIEIRSIEGKLLTILSGHEHNISSLSFSPDDKMIVSSGADKTIRLWKIDGELVVKITVEEYSDYSKTFEKNDEFSRTYFNIFSVCFSPDGKKIVSVQQDNTVRVWSLSGEFLGFYYYPLEKSRQYGNENSHVMFSPDGRYLVVDLDKVNLLILNSECKLLGIISVGADSNSQITNITFSHDSKMILVGFKSGMLRLWGIDGVFRKNIISKASEVMDIDISEDDKTILVSYSDKIQLLNIDGTILQEYKDYNCFARFIPGRKSFLTLMSGQLQMLPNVIGLEGSRIFSFPVENIQWHFGKSDINLREKLIAKVIVYSNTNKIPVDLNAELKIVSMDGNFINTIIKAQYIGTPTFNPDGKLIAAIISDDSSKKANIIYLWNTKGALIKVFKGHAGFINDIKFTNDGKQLISCSSEDNTIRIWTLDGKLNKTIKCDKVSGLSISPDSDILFCHIAKELHEKVKLFSIRGGYFLNSLSTDFENFEFTDNGKILLIRGDYSAATLLLTKNNGSINNPITCKLLNSYDVKNSFLLRSSSISPSGKFVVTGSNDTNIYVWSINGELLFTLKGHTGPVINLKFSIDEQRIVSESEGGLFKIWDIKNRSCITTIRLYDKDSFITYTSDYYYRLSGDAVNAVAFIKDDKMKAYGFDQFDLRHNRPDIVLERLYPDEKSRPAHIRDEIKKYKKYWEYRVLKNGFTPEQVSGRTKIHAPEVYDIRLNGAPVEVSAEERKQGIKEADTNVSSQDVSLSFKLRDEEGSNLDVIGYKIFVNGVPLHGQYIKRFPGVNKIQEVTEKITLSSVPDAGANPGDNKIEMCGFTSDGVESKREIIYLRYTGADRDARGNLYIVAIGVNDYSRGSGFQSLTYAETDVKDIVRTFSESGKSSYKEVIPVIFMGDDVNRGIISSIRERLNKTTVNDTVIFFMSGHGVRADTDKSKADELARYFNLDYSIGDIAESKGKTNIYYYMTGDSFAERPWEKGIPLDAVRYALDGIPARQKLLLIDTCQSGEKPELSGYTPSEDRLKDVRSKKGKVQADVAEKGVKLVYKGSLDKRGMEIVEAYTLDMREMSEMFPELRRGTGTIEISAANGNQSALESAEWKNGAFTYVIKDAILKGKAKNENGKITAKSLRSYVLSNVERLTSGDQIPMVCRDIAGRDFVISE